VGFASLHKGYNGEEPSAEETTKVPEIAEIAGDRDIGAEDAGNAEPAELPVPVCQPCLATSTHERQAPNAEP